jgi:hypothetical protein
MLTDTYIYKKYASVSDYDAFVNESISTIKTKFPNVQLRSWGEFRAFLDGLVPKLIHKYLLLSGSMKNCSGISPDFTEIACQAGFPVMTMVVPGHQLNLVLTREGPYSVDLSYIQFTCKHQIESDEPSEEERQEVINNYRALYRDPFRALQTQQLPKQYFGNVRYPHGTYHTFSPDPGKAIQDYDIEDTEETFPERFERIK